MPTKSLFCIASSRSDANQIIASLKAANFSSKDISVLLPDKESNDGFERETKIKAPTGKGILTGSVIGGTLGWIAGIATLAIPGVGPLIAAGPIVAALSSAAVGTAVGVTAGGITGGLISFGVPENEARRYEGKVLAGSMLIAVHTEDDAEITRAKDIFKRAGAEDICTPGEIYAKGAPSGDNVSNSLP